MHAIRVTRTIMFTGASLFGYDVDEYCKSREGEKNQNAKKQIVIYFQHGELLLSVEYGSFQVFRDDSSK
jgi:hypothetical protein